MNSATRIETRGAPARSEGAAFGFGRPGQARARDAVRLWAGICAVAFAFGAGAARAQDASNASSSSAGSTSGSKAGKRTQINFEDQLVEGQAQKPELFYLLQQRNANFKRLIRLREDFLPEMRKTADEIVHKGSGR